MLPVSSCGGVGVETVREARLSPSWGRVPARRGRHHCERDGGARRAFPLGWGGAAEGREAWERWWRARRWEGAATLQTRPLERQTDEPEGSPAFALVVTANAHILKIS